MNKLHIDLYLNLGYRRLPLSTVIPVTAQGGDRCIVVLGEAND